VDVPDLNIRWEKEIAALRKMNDLGQRHIVRFLTAFRRHTRKNGDEYYLMFEWADGGNLRTYWKTNPSPVLSDSLVKEVVQQIAGLATALNAAHNLNKTGASYPHDDLKPENILVFPGHGSIGTLKIGDWGEAKFQGVRTEMRPSGTEHRSGTIRYEAPEVKTGIRDTYLSQPRGHRSRLYDIWALGCVTLEFLVWLLYGEEGLAKFNADVNGPTFYQISTENGKDEARVHEKVVYWMDLMVSHPAAKPYITAIGDVLVLVRTSLLVVKLPYRLGTNLLMQGSGLVDRARLDSGVGPEPDRIVTRPQSQEATAGTSNRDEMPSVPKIVISTDDLPELELPRIPTQRAPEPSGNVRGLSHEICQQLDIILSEDDNPSYWSPERPPELSPAVIPTPGSITPAIEMDSNANGNDIKNALKRLAVRSQEEPRVGNIHMGG
jgi:serine/threonine protein kinase